MIHDRSRWWWFFVGLWPLILGLLAWAFLRIRAHTKQRPAEPARGLVVFVSAGPGSAVAKAAALYHVPTLEHLWLIHSEGSAEEARKIQAELIASAALRVNQLHVLPMSNAEFQDPEVVRQLIENEVFAGLPPGLRQRDVVIDFTSGTKETTAGAVLAGLPPGRRLQRTPPLVRDPANQTGLAPGKPIEVDINYRLWRTRR